MTNNTLTLQTIRAIVQEAGDSLLDSMAEPDKLYHVLVLLESITNLCEQELLKETLQEETKGG